MLRLGGRSDALPMAPYLAGLSFDPEATEAMGRAFAMACRSLGLADTSDPMTQMIARHIIEAAGAGERDPDRLYQAVLNWAKPAA